MGCGTGSAALPVLAANPDAFVAAVDFSPSAVRSAITAATQSGEANSHNAPTSRSPTEQICRSFSAEARSKLGLSFFWDPLLSKHSPDAFPSIAGFGSDRFTAFVADCTLGEDDDNSSLRDCGAEQPAGVPRTESDSGLFANGNGPAAPRQTLWRGLQAAIRGGWGASRRSLAAALEPEVEDATRLAPADADAACAAEAGLADASDPVEAAGRGAGAASAEATSTGRTPGDEVDGSADLALMIFVLSAVHTDRRGGGIFSEAPLALCVAAALCLGVATPVQP